MPSLFAALMLLAALAFAPLSAALAAEQTFRLHEGVTLYVVNDKGEDFNVGLDVRDLNLYANGPREVMFKVYDPDGKPVVRKIIEDDGCTSANFPDRAGGWDHELQYYANLNAKGTKPTIRWSAWSDPKRLATQVARKFDEPVKGKKGVYRIVLAGTWDHYVTVRLPDSLKYGFCGHPTFMHGIGSSLKQAFVYVPKDMVGLFVACQEPDEPRNRNFKITAPDGKVLFNDQATGGFNSNEGNHWHPASQEFPKGTDYNGKIMKVEVSDGPNDYLFKMTFIFKKVEWGDYVSMGANAIFCPDEATANAIKGGTIVVDDQVFFHPFQVRFHEWLKKNGGSLNENLRKDLTALFGNFRLLETSDGRGSGSWTNWAYAMGYYGCIIFRPSWVLVNRGDVPAEIKEIIKEGLIMAGDRLSFATHIEKVNGNAFSQINVALWYAHRATGDPIQKERFETFWQRWTTEGWGPGSGLSKSGDSQEHFAHDCHYGSYLMDNWRASGNQWIRSGITGVEGTGITGDATDDPRFQKVLDRYKELYTYLYCREAAGASVAANPWSGRTHMHPHKETANWESPQFKWKGEPGPDLTASVNGGDEWFAARRKSYYFLTFHGRIPPEWMSQCFPGQLGFSGGTICQLTVPGKGPVLAGTLHDSYGGGMHPSQWANLHIHSIVGEMWDGSPLVAAIGEHDDAKLNGNTVTSSGEVRNAHVRSARSYTYNPDSIDCSVKLAPSDYARALSIWSHDRMWSEVKQAYEMIPFMPKSPDGAKATEVTADGKPLTATVGPAQKIRIDRGGFGVEIQLEKPMPVKLGQNGTVLIQLADPAAKPAAADTVALKYKLVPFGG
ncbi:MAG: hypothetical protein NTW19_22705 [Planctomycetota bacterium]|nr:hypothetical protein [Planctomycetota bacterium]